MKRLLALVAGGLGLRALLRRRSRPAHGPSPADELKAKLAATKAPEREPEREPEPEQEPEAAPEGLGGRRADVHERARRAIDELREP